MMLKAKLIDTKKLRKKHPELTSDTIAGMAGGTTYKLYGVGIPQGVEYPLNDLADHIRADSEMPVYIHRIGSDEFLRLTYDGN